MKPFPLSSCALVALVLFLTACTQKEKAVAAESSAPADANVVTLSPANLKHLSLQSELATRGNLPLVLKAVGRLSENLNRTAKVTTTLEGRLIQFNVDLNDRVRAGQVVGLIQTPELLGRALELKAPIDGVVVERRSTVGELIGKDTEVCVISDPTDLWLLAEIKERDLAAIQVGQEAEFSVLAWPGERFHGRLVLVGHRVETLSRTLEVRIAVANADGRLKPGMFADVEIATTAVPDVVTIPDTALQSLEEQQIVFVALSETRFEKRVVRPGLEHRGRVQVLAGVQPGERVVTDGSFILKSELLKSELGEE